MCGVTDALSLGVAGFNSLCYGGNVQTAPGKNRVNFKPPAFSGSEYKGEVKRIDTDGNGTENGMFTFACDDARNVKRIQMAESDEPVH